MKIRPEIIQEIIAQEPEVRRNQVQAMCRKAFKALDSAAGLSESDPPWLFKLKIKGRDALNEHEVESAFLEAAKGNPDIFRKAAAALSSPLDDADIKREISNIEWLLLERWVAAENDPFFRSFCYYNDKALGKLVGFLLRGNEYGDKFIRKIWERLGLKKGRPLLFRDADIKKNPHEGRPWAVPVYYKKLIQAEH